MEVAPVTISDFRSEKVYERQLTANDVNEISRLYVKRLAARRICPQAFPDPPDHQENCTRNLWFYDVAFNRLPMVFRKRGNKCYLMGHEGWGRFVNSNRLRPGDTVRIHQLICKRGTGASFFMIGRVKVAGILIG